MSEQFKKELKEFSKSLYGEISVSPKGSPAIDKNMIRDKDEALSGLKNAKYKENVLERLSLGIRLDKDFMLKAIGITPKAYEYAAIGIKSTNFTIDAIKRNLGVCTILSDKLLNDPKILDATEKHIIDSYKEHYKRTLYGARHCYPTHDEPVKTPSEIYVRNVEKTMPCLSEQLKQARQDVLRENAEFVCKKVSEPRRADYEYWMNEVRQNCPELEEDIWKYRADHSDELIEMLSKDDLSTRNFSAWLEKEIEEREAQEIDIDGLAVQQEVEEVELDFDEAPVLEK